MELLFWTDPHPFWSWPYSKLSSLRLTSFRLNFLLVQSHQAEVIIVQRLILRLNNVTSRVRVEPKLMRSGRRKNNVFIPFWPRCRLKICLYTVRLILFEVIKIMSIEKLTSSQCSYVYQLKVNCKFIFCRRSIQDSKEKRITKRKKKQRFFETLIFTYISGQI